MFQYYRTYYGYYIGLEIRKQIGKKFIYQMNNGVQIKRRWKKPRNPRSDKQQANRWKIKQAVLAWKALPESEWNYYRGLEPFKKIMSGYNFFVSNYVKLI